eukprot:11645503-Alexandrium_andersonii.AAC.1
MYGSNLDKAKVHVKGARAQPDPAFPDDAEETYYWVCMKRAWGMCSFLGGCVRGGCVKRAHPSAPLC